MISNTNGQIKDTVLQNNKNVTISAMGQEITPDVGYEGMEKVTITGVTSGVDSDIVAGNIKKDVEILGVVGTYEGDIELIALPKPYISMNYRNLQLTIYQTAGEYAKYDIYTAVETEVGGVSSVTDFSLLVTRTWGNTTYTFTFPTIENITHFYIKVKAVPLPEYEEQFLPSESDVIDWEFTSGTEGLTYTYSTTNTCYTCQQTIPSGVEKIYVASYYDNGTNGKHCVTDIAGNFANENGTVTEVHLPNTIMNVGQYFCRRTTNLKYVNIPSLINNFNASIMGASTNALLDLDCVLFAPRNIIKYGGVKYNPYGGSMSFIRAQSINYPISYTQIQQAQYAVVFNTSSSQTTAVANSMGKLVYNDKITSITNMCSTYTFIKALCFMGTYTNGVDTLNISTKINGFDSNYDYSTGASRTFSLYVENLTSLDFFYDDSTGIPRMGNLPTKRPWLLSKIKLYKANGDYIRNTSIALLQAPEDTINSLPASTLKEGLQRGYVVDTPNIDMWYDSSTNTGGYVWYYDETFTHAVGDNDIYVGNNYIDSTTEILTLYGKLGV